MNPFRTTLHALRPHARTRDALPARRAGLGRAHRFRACPGEELAADGLRLAGPVGRACLRAGLAIGDAARSCRGSCRSTSSAKPRPSRPPIADYRPADPQVAWHLARFIEQVRAIPADPVIVRQNWLRAYEFTTDRGALALNDYARANDPFAKVGKRQVAVEVSSVIRASPDSFRVAWIERRYENGQLAATERWTAILTIACSSHATPIACKQNPLGIYVNAINWSKELGQ